MTRRIKPYQQGNLDSLCGAYCAVNVVHYLCGPFPENKATDVFLNILDHLEDSTDLVSRIYEGTGRREIRQLMNFLMKKYPIIWHKPFEASTDLSVHKVWKSITQFLHEHNGIVIAGLCYKGGGHWTLIREITPKSIRLFDSDNMKVVYRHQCSVKKHSKNRPYVLQPSTLYFVHRS